MGSSDPVSLLLSYGPMGVMLAVFLWLVISGHLVPGKEHDRVVLENEQLRKQAPDAVLALAASTDALKEAAQVQRDTLVALEIRRRHRE